MGRAGVRGCERDFYEISDQDNFVTILSSNVRGIINNWSLIESINLKEYDFLAFNEIWEIKDFELLQLDGFEIKSIKTRDNTRGGGVIIFGKTNIKHEEVSVPFLEGVFESVAIKIGDLIIVNIYRPPSGSREIFLQEFETILATYGHHNIIVTGDFNINFREQNHEIFNLCEQYGVKIRLNGITRPASGTCLDNFISNMDGVFSITNISVADHLAIKSICKLPYKLSKKKIIYQYRAMKDVNWLLFKNGLHNLVPEGNNINTKWESVSNQIKNIITESFPLKNSKHEYKFNMSRALMKSRDKKNKLLRDYKRGRIAKEIYINYNKIYRKLVQSEQEKSFKNKLQEAGSCGKKKWKVLKKQLFLEKSKIEIDSVTVNNNILTNRMDIAKSFKNHFETCALNLANNLPPSGNTAEIMQQGDTWSFKTTTEVEIVEIINGLVSKNSCGPDLLSNRMIKAEKYVFAKLLKPLINESISSGSFPDILKHATVIPVYKKGDKDNLNNYRPIALLPVMSKIFEKVLNLQLTKVIDIGFIDDNQFGFRQSHSTEDALIKFADKVQKELSNKKHVVSIFVDVSKAFDSCDHGILLTKIKKTGLDETGINLIASYLLDRRQTVVVNGVDGGSFVINIGVGQGTILGPTFFKIYIMDLHLHTNLLTIKFADDSTFIGSASSKDALEELANIELDKIGKWFASNRLTLHPNKSKYLIHSRDKLLELKLNGITLQRSGYGLQEESVKLLGLEIDKNLDWKVHIKSVTKKIGKGNYLLWRHNKKLSLSMKKMVYESFVRCHLLYGITLWGGASPTTLKPLEKVLSKIWSKIGPRRMHTLNRLNMFKILKLSDELKLQESKFIWKWDKNKVPKSLRTIIDERHDNLRGRRFNINRNWKTGNISYRLATRAGQTINYLTNFRTKQTLIKNLKKDIIRSYSFNCRLRNCYVCGNMVGGT